MPRNALAVAENNSQKSSKSKPRYTEAENEILFESWWDPQKRQELVGRLGRKMSALRSQFCRLLKEKGLSNQDYYNLMQSRFVSDSGVLPRKRSRELKDIDRFILETFCKHQALGNSRSEACDELQHKFGNSFTPAALKLRFYRLVKRFRYNDNDLQQIGQQILSGQKPAEKVFEDSQPKVTLVRQAADIQNIPFNQTIEHDNTFFYQLSSLPEMIRAIEERLNAVESNQKRQLDLRGFIEHLLAVERDLKREDKLMEEIQKLMDENEKAVSQMGKDRERLKKREDELSDVYKMLDTMLSDFMHLESVSKLASLGDFMHRLEITVDQFGNVLRSKRITQ
jgi:hypothetical protein